MYTRAFVASISRAFSGQPGMPMRFPPPWQSLPPNSGDYSQMLPGQPGFRPGFPPPQQQHPQQAMHPRFGPGGPPPLPQFPPMNHNSMRFGPPPGYQPGGGGGGGGGGMNNVPPPGMPPGMGGFNPNFAPPGMPPPFQPPPLYSDMPQQQQQSNEPAPPDPRPWYDLPAGIMISLIRTEDTEYKSLDPKDLVIPPPQLITEKIMRAMDEFYSMPNNSAPRNAEGWEKLGMAL